jgi:hypothetical protein
MPSGRIGRVPCRILIQIKQRSRDSTHKLQGVSPQVAWRGTTPIRNPGSTQPARRCRRAYVRGVAQCTFQGARRSGASGAAIRDSGAIAEAALQGGHRKNADRAAANRTHRARRASARERFHAGGRNQRRSGIRGCFVLPAPVQASHRTLTESVSAHVSAGCARVTDFDASRGHKVCKCESAKACEERMP